MRKLLLLLLLPSIALAGDHAAHRRAIEQNLATAVAIEGVRGKSLQERMRELGIPAISYAVVEDGQIVLAAAYGQADVERNRKATPRTLFQAASISKPVTAIGVMELVERGRLSLDAPVNTLLRSWTLPENDLTAKMPVTPRLLLSHSAGTTVHGFPGYAMSDTRPTLEEVLQGKPPANTAPILVDLAPNSKFRYSGGGTTLMQAALVDHTATPFPDFMRRTVLRPLGMLSSTYEQPLPPSRRGEAATAYRLGRRAVGGQWHVYPEMAAAGLWTTPSDLAKVIIEMQTALAGRPSKLLSIDAARHMVTPRLPAGNGTSIGLGFFVEDRRGTRYFAHGGANEGFRAFLVGSVDGSRGAVVMTNSDNGVVANEVLQTIAREYQWPGYASTPLKTAPLSTADADRYTGRFQVVESTEVVSIRRSGEQLEYLHPLTGWQPMYPLADTSIARTDRDVRYVIEPDGILVVNNASARSTIVPARRLPADAPPTAHELLAAGEIDKALAAFREEFRAKPESVPEEKLNSAGYAFLNIGRYPQAIALFQLNTELYPASANTWDSLGEALMIAGERERSIAAYEELLRRVDADPNAESATKEMLRNLAQRRLKELR